MKRENKNAVIAELTEKFKEANNLYIADTSSIGAVDTNIFRRELYKNGITMLVAKNTLILKAMRNSGKDFGELEGTLKGTSALLFSENMKAPAQAILKFRKKGDKPALKGAYIDSAIFIGDNQLVALTQLKSKEELIGDVIGLLQSPIQSVVSALQSGGGTIAGIVKTLSEKN
ncbi:MAG: 50S ribosomal protein L10 [Bacteroidota bacterium]|nr:50S ribosomal protein L10 [Bacteroidota bacterium]